MVMEFVILACSRSCIRDYRSACRAWWRGYLVPATLFIGIDLGLIDGITPQSVVGLSVIMMIFVGLSSTLSYMKLKMIDYRSGFIFFLGSIPGTTSRRFGE